VSTKTGQLHFALHTTNIARHQVESFLRHLLSHIRGPIVLLWDNSKTHQGPLIRALISRFPRLQIEQLPSYAPELNPDEGVWNHAKRELANAHLRSADELQLRLLDVFDKLDLSQRHMRACVHRSELKFF
jgi:transposase